MCVVAVLLSTTVQVAHFCGVRRPDVHTALEIDAISPGTGPCMVCLLAQSVGAIILWIALFVSFRSEPRISAPQMPPRPFIESFVLYIRPPPLY